MCVCEYSEINLPSLFPYNFRISGYYLSSSALLVPKLSQIFKQDSDDLFKFFILPLSTPCFECFHVNLIFLFKESRKEKGLGFIERYMM